MPWKCFPEIGKPFPGYWQYSATRRLYISSLSQNWFWSDSKLVQIWFKTGSDLIQNWFKSDSKLNLVALSPFLWGVQGGGGPDISRLIHHWILLPSHVMCRYEEALTFPDLFKSESSIKSETSSGQHYGGKHFLRIWFISEFSSISVIRSKYLCLIFESHWNLNLLTQSNSLILLCFFIFDSFPHWFKSDFCLGEEALTCPNWFKPYFRYCLTLHIMKFEVRKLWHFQTDSRLISVEARKLWYIQTDSSLISVNVWSSITWSFRWESSDISRLIQVLFPLLSSPLKHEVWGKEAFTFPDWFKSFFCYCLTLYGMKFEVRKLWQFKTDSSLIFLLSVISRLIHIWVPLLSHPPISPKI